MWPWQESSTNHVPISEPELTDALRRRLDELNERQDRFERVVKELRLEWDEMYDKMRLLLARLSKRIKDAGQLDPDSTQPAQDAPRTTIAARPPLDARFRKGNY